MKYFIAIRAKMMTLNKGDKFMNIQDKMKQLRRDAKLSQAEFAEKIGVAQSTIAGWENGRRLPNPSTLKKIADFYNVTLDYLFEDSENEETIDIEQDEERLNENKEARLKAQEELTAGKYMIDYFISRIIDYQGFTINVKRLFPSYKAYIDAVHKAINEGTPEPIYSYSILHDNRTEKNYRISNNDLDDIKNKASIYIRYLISELEKKSEIIEESNENEYE